MKLPRHPWDTYEHRFVVDRAWENYPLMAAGLMKDWLDAGGPKSGKPKPPTKGQIHKVAAAGDWLQKRSELVAAARAAGMAKLERRLGNVIYQEALFHLKNLKRGRRLLELGSDYVEAIEAAKAKDPEKLGAIDSTPAALAAMRVGSQLANEASKALSELRKGLLPADMQDADEEGAETIDTGGVVVIPAQQDAAAWDAARDVKLLDGRKPGPEEEED